MNKYLKSKIPKPSPFAMGLGKYLKLKNLCLSISTSVYPCQSVSISALICGFYGVKT